jgi:hypothetical protein
MLSSICNFVSFFVSRRPDPIATVVEELAPLERRPLVDFFPRNDTEFAEMCNPNTSRARLEELSAQSLTREEFFEQFGLRPTQTMVRAIPPPVSRTEVVQSPLLPTQRFLVTRHSGEMTPSDFAPVVEDYDDEGGGSPKIGYWRLPRVGQTEAERMESLKQRADAVNMYRIAADRYAIRGTRSLVRVNEMDHHMLFPGEMPSREPHFHGLRYMTEEETRKRPLGSDDEEGNKRARN